LNNTLHHCCTIHILFCSSERSPCPYFNYQDVDPCINGCLNELQASLGTIFLTRLATGSILKLAVPYFTQKMKRANEAKGVDPDDLTDVEQAYIQDVSAVRGDVHCVAARLYAVVGDKLALLWYE
jgi:hypothetical protein